MMGGVIGGNIIPILCYSPCKNIKSKNLEISLKKYNKLYLSRVTHSVQGLSSRGALCLKIYEMNI